MTRIEPSFRLETAKTSSRLNVAPSTAPGGKLERDWPPIYVRFQGLLFRSPSTSARAEYFARCLSSSTIVAPAPVA